MTKEAEEIYRCFCWDQDFGSRSFGGDQPVNATAWAWTLDGTQFAACTTVQYGYKPATNSTTLTVIPQSTDTTTVTKTSEQLQKQAQQSGWLSTYNEFSWWYPWYRMHFKITISDPTTIDVGVSLLPGGNTQSSKGLSVFSQLNAALVSSFIAEAGTLMGEYAVAKLGFLAGQLWATLIAFGVEAGEDGYILRSYWNNGGEMLAFGIVNVIMGLIATQGGFAANFLKLLTGMNAATMVALTLITTGGEIAAGGLSIKTPADWGQVGLSIGVAALALGRWAGLMMG